VRVRLARVDAGRRGEVARRLAQRLEGLLALEVPAARPDLLPLRQLRREHERRVDEVLGLGHVAADHLPGELAQHLVDGRLAGREVLVALPLVGGRRPRRRGQPRQRRDQRQVAVLVDEVAEPLVRVVEEVLLPGEALAVGPDRALAPADHLPLGAVERPLRPERPARPRPVGPLDGLDGPPRLVARVDDGAAVLARERARGVEPAHGPRRAAVRAAELAPLDDPGRLVGLTSHGTSGARASRGPSTRRTCP
jgi:hypothetical protein